jgi:hypothetical protein
LFPVRESMSLRRRFLKFLPTARRRQRNPRDRLFSVLRRAAPPARYRRSLQLRDRQVSYRIVDIAAPEFSLEFRHFSERYRCKLWPRNEKLIIENDFNARPSRRD